MSPHDYVFYAAKDDFALVSARQGRPSGANHRQLIPVGTDAADSA